jgi:hypothetical protein
MTDQLKHLTGKTGWIAFDLDGTLAFVDHTKPYVESEIGEPIPAMVALLKWYVANGWEVRIFTARAAEPDLRKRQEIEVTIKEWCLEHLGMVLAVTCVKDYGIRKIYDDRAVQVEYNTGRIIEDGTVRSLESRAKAL